MIRKNAQRVYEQQRTEKYVKDDAGKPVSAEYLRRKLVNESLAVLGLWADYAQLNEALTLRMDSGTFKRVASNKSLRRLGRAAKKQGLLAPVLAICKCAKGIFPYSDTDMRKIQFVKENGLPPKK